ncbi:MAG: hypothetical protein ACTSWP_03245 [Candidatus Freyarchaeota archaeon]|nr:hypothetical protein [Candidatus Freyrarchaeum guaymaensis]
MQATGASSWWRTKAENVEAYTRVSKFLFFGAFGFTFTPWRYRGMKANSSFVRKAGRK